jgi:Neuraminidase (sialidase)
VTKDVLLPPGPGNPRNSEGDFIELQDGRVIFIYTHFTGDGGDHGTAHLAQRVSTDGGLTWTDEDEVVVPNEGGFNVMSVSLLRLQNGSIALFYMVKNSLEDCRPVMRVSRDEAKTWSDPVGIIPDAEEGYHVLNNDRVVQLADGRLICPVALHNRPSYIEPDWSGILLCYFSDDSGQTWQRSTSALKGSHPDGTRILLQEPGVLELQDGRLWMWARTNEGYQYQSWSADGGDTWTQPVATGLRSPRSPASIERLPGRDELVLVWNDHAQFELGNDPGRTPLAIALSSDDGKTWQSPRILEDDPGGWYCYTAIDFVGDRVLLGHCAGERAKSGLNVTQITSFSVDWLLTRTSL